MVAALTDRPGGRAQGDPWRATIEARAASELVAFAARPTRDPGPGKYKPGATDEHPAAVDEQGRYSTRPGVTTGFDAPAAIGTAVTSYGLSGDHTI